jgi:hypothetical protein
VTFYVEIISEKNFWIWNGTDVSIYVTGIVKKDKMDGACSTYGESRGAYRVLVEKPEGRRPLGRPKPR